MSIKPQTNLNSYNSGSIHCHFVQIRVEINLKSYKTRLIITLIHAFHLIILSQIMLNGSFK